MATIKNTGKSYIGCTVKSLAYRKYGHHRDVKSGKNTPFHRAIGKYGKRSVVWFILEDGITDWDVLVEREMYWIKEKNTFRPNGYNLTLGGEGAYGHVVSEEAKKTMGAANIGKTPWNKGKKTPPEIVEKHRQMLLGRKHGPEFVAKMTVINRRRGLARVGIPRSPETRAKMPKFPKGHVPWNKGKKMSREAVLKMSAKAKGRIPKNLSILHSPAVRKKISFTKRRNNLLRRMLLVLLQRINFLNNPVCFTYPNEVNLWA